MRLTDQQRRFMSILQERCGEFCSPSAFGLQPIIGSSLMHKLGRSRIEQKYDSTHRRTLYRLRESSPPSLDHDRLNRARVQRAERAAMDADAKSLDEGIIDLLADLRHLCHDRGLDFDYLNRLAQMHYVHECSQECDHEAA